MKVNACSDEVYFFVKAESGADPVRLMIRAKNVPIMTGKRRTMNINTNDLMNLLDQAVRLTVHQTVRELRKNGFLRENDSIAYESTQNLLKAHFDAIKEGEPGNPEVYQALESLSQDEYHNIIYLYYYKGMTIEGIAEAYDCDPTTIQRNKKRLCIEISKKIG